MANQLFDRFGDGAHLAVVLADREARALGHPLVDTDHLLLGLLQADGLLGDVFAESSAPIDAVRRQIVARSGADAPLPRGDTTFSDALRTTLRSAVMYARRKDRTVTCLDLLVEFSDARLGGGIEILKRLGIDSDGVRSRAGLAWRRGEGSRGAEPSWSGRFAV